MTHLCNLLNFRQHLKGRKSLPGARFEPTTFHYTPKKFAVGSACQLGFQSFYFCHRILFVADIITLKIQIIWTLLVSNNICPKIYRIATNNSYRYLYKVKNKRGQCKFKKMQKCMLNGIWQLFTNTAFRLQHRQYIFYS